MIKSSNGNESNLMVLFMSICFPAPYSLGAQLYDSGCRFTLYAPDQDGVHLLLWHQGQQPQRLAMREYKRGYWTKEVADVVAGQDYSFEISHNGQTWCVADPYAQAVTGPLSYQPPYTPSQSTLLARCQVVDHESFDWQGVSSPQRAIRDTVIFETHVKGLTQQHPDVAPAQQGRYLGLVSPAMLAFYQQHQINCLQLLPITSCLPEPHLLSQQKTNYWGYNPYVWMAPNPRYAEKNAVNELKTAIRELHRHDIEVILDVVFNHTAEGGEDGPILHYKALDHAMYLHDGQQLRNYTGCGNTLDIRHPAALKQVLDTLRMWVTDYHVDGFRFDLAATQGRNGDTFNPHNAFFLAIAQDPILSKVKLIAEPWDIGPDGYQLGQFPINWAECNDKIRDTTRSLWRGDPGILQDFATRLMGSRDVFSAAHWPDHLPINYVTYHDGFTLQDVVSYAKRHNHANGENNRDGHGDNRSANYGVEGPTNNPDIIEVRAQQKRNMMASILFSLGTPHILMADVLGHSQQGNNNAYCQDNPISWLNWQTQDHTWSNWLATMITRRNAIVPRFIDALSGTQRHCNRITWRHPNGDPIHDHQWPSLQALSCQITLGAHHPDAGQSMLIAINSSDTGHDLRLPPNHQWRIVCDTATGETTVAPPASCQRLAAKSFLVCIDGDWL
ncbi:glycogen debranching protein [Salinivibrio kushneri]|uniref:glycogen debranching protein n=1 Tax=Salinivibrio kushneri TaxID=1908198 RepID=UPI00098889F0|nr:alpha-amylase family glycosyl hydrolase [Salinivibrio kushneri]OOE51325.1 glycogen debranching enzyme [Salinivibrio kushneri]